MRYKTNAPKQIALTVTDFLTMLGNQKTEARIYKTLDAIYKHSANPTVYGKEFLNFWLLYGFYNLIHPTYVKELEVSSCDFETTTLPSDTIAMIYMKNGKPNATLVTLQNKN